MRNKIKRILVVLMAVVMLVSSSNLQSFAAEMEDSGISITGEESVIAPEENSTDLDLEEQETSQPIQEDMEASAEEEIVADEIEPVQEESSNDETSSELEKEKEDPITGESSEQTEQKEESTEESEEQAEDPAEKSGDSETVFSEEPENSEESAQSENFEDPEEDAEQSAMEGSDEELSQETEEAGSPEAAEDLHEESGESEEPQESEIGTENPAETESGEQETATDSEINEELGMTEDPEAEDETQQPLEDIVIVPDPFVPLEAWYEFSVGGRVSYPLTEEGTITTSFGQIDEDHTSPHQGIDLAISEGSPVIAVKAGTVTVAHMWNGTAEDGYGNYVDIQHDDGMVTRYAHLSEINITEGMDVTEGQQIGRVGSTGRSTGPHLHFEVIENENVDPYYYLYPVTVVFDLNYSDGTVHMFTGEAEYKYFMENIPYSYRDANTGEEVYAEDGHLLKLTNPGEIRMDAYDAFGYAIPVTAYDLSGEAVEIFRDKEGFYEIPTDGSVVRVLAGKEVSRARLMKSGGTNAVYTDGMTLNTNAVLRFAQAIGFDVSGYLSSPYAWQVVSGTADGLYSTPEGQAMMSGSIPYTDGGAIGSGTASTVWPGINLWIGANSFEELNTYLHSGSYPGVQCAGLVNTFFGYIYQNLYSDADWKAYYDAYSYGTANNLSGTFDSWNNVGSVEAGLEGLNNYKEAYGYYVQVCDNYTMTHDDFVSMLTWLPERSSGSPTIRLVSMMAMGIIACSMPVSISGRRTDCTGCCTPMITA